MLKKPGILIIGPAQKPNCQVGGEQTCVNYLLASKLKDKYQFFLLNTNKTLLVANNVFLNSINSIKNSLKLIYFLAIKKIRIAHFVSPNGKGFLEKELWSFFAKIFGKKTILHIQAHSFDVFFLSAPKIIRKIIKNLFLFNDKIVVLGKYWQNFFLNNNLADEKKLEIVPNFVSSPFFKTDQEPSLKKEFFSVLLVGNLGKRKGVFDVLKAVPSVVKFKKNIKFVFVGDGEKEPFETIREKINSLSEKQDTKKYIALKGKLRYSEVIKEYQKADIFILPSYHEGLPFAILEAMAAGLPVVSTKVGSIPEVIKDGENGFLINPGDYQNLAGSILELIQDENLRKKMGENNVSKIKKDFSSEKFEDKIDKIYQSLL